ncbi:MAG: 5-oxoprolinase subunit PxpA [Bacteroidota bacterium]
MNSNSIDINCDMGESYGRFKVGNDEALFPWISSCNIACGFHGGDPWHIEQTIKSALKHNLRIGAHPSYPDLAGFGRRAMQIVPSELKSIIKYQIAAVKGLTESLGGSLTYVKPHGALYNTAAKTETEATVIMEAIREIDDSLLLMGLAGSPIEQWAKDHKIPFIAEAFADRQYTPEGRLMSRQLSGALIQDPLQAAQQVMDIATNQKVQTANGSYIPLKAQSICIHGDNPAALEILKQIHASFASAQWAIKPHQK